MRVRGIDIQRPNPSPSDRPTVLPALARICTLPLHRSDVPFPQAASFQRRLFALTHQFRRALQLARSPKVFWSYSVNPGAPEAKLRYGAALPVAVKSPPSHPTLRSGAGFRAHSSSSASPKICRSAGEPASDCTCLPHHPSRRSEGMHRPMIAQDS